MTRILSALALLLLVPSVASARAGDPDRSFGRQGTVTLKATAADAVGGAVKVISGNRILAGGAAAGQFVVVRLRPTGTLDSRFGTGGQVVPALPGTTLDGVRALAVFRDGRIVAAGTLRGADGTTRMVAFRLLPTGEIDPSFGGGFGYVLAGPSGSELGAMVMDANGNITLGGSRAGNVPIMVRLLADGSPDLTFGANATVDGAVLGIGGRVTGLLVKADGTTTFTVGGSATQSFPAAFSVLRVTATGVPDPTWGGGDGIVYVQLGPGTAPGIGASAVRQGPKGTTLVAGTDLTASGTPRGAVIRLLADGNLDTRFGGHGVARVARAGREIRIKAMVRDSAGRILLAGSGQPPEGLVMRLRASGRRDSTFGNNGITYPLLGRPPGGDPIYTTLDAIDANGPRAIIAGSAAGPGQLLRGGAAGTIYTGRFALTVSKLR
ncbi:delta-60 repeat domain-containing protein [Solirubrobacter soli]|uniref:delta-60 repeat domain-containing protein n=1 Tax=Solirubrobacter soli TaxID=363832 RepID=UPI0003FF6DC1|nr:delta-60 repeat domain-containing protein [Solirubrobacter soli]